MSALKPGTILNDRYHVVRPIRAGGMGAVYEAVDFRLHNTVAVKQMTAQGGSELDRAFEREAKLLAALRHSALPVVIDYFIEAGGRFLVMQYIEGEDLEHVLRRNNGPCSQDDVLVWAFAVLDTLEYLHGHHPPIVHRDIKPANLKRTPRGEIVLLDFGLAKGRVEIQPTLHDDERSIFGFTPNYAPPEQLEGRGTDPRSDIYALGATLYHLVTGVSPPSARDRTAAVTTRRPDPVMDSLTVNRGVSPAFSAALARALALDAAARFRSADDMRRELAAVAGEAIRQGPRPKRSAGARRVDAAMPSQAEVGRQIDLIVQVRFAESPRLGLEDWPTKRRPDKIEQASEAVHIEYPVDPRTGTQIPARLRVKLVAPDFVIEGTAEHIIEVPPDDYSKRLAFLIAPRRSGYCRVNVEIYAADALYLGTIPVEAEVVTLAAGHSVLHVANLVLGLFTSERKDLAEVEQRVDDTTQTIRLTPPMPAAAAPKRVSADIDAKDSLPLAKSRTAYGVQQAETRIGSQMPAVTAGRSSSLERLETRLPDDVQAVPAPMAPAAATRLPRWLFVVAPMAILMMAAIVVVRITGPISTDFPPEGRPSAPPTVAPSSPPEVAPPSPIAKSAPPEIAPPSPPKPVMPSPTAPPARQEPAPLPSAPGGGRPVAEPAPDPPPPSAPVRVGGNIKQPTKVKHVDPVYPPMAQSARVQGVVIVEAIIGPDGSVREAKVLRSIPLLDRAALDAVRQWQYTPTLLDGVAVPVIITVTVRFTLQ